MDEILANSLLRDIELSGSVGERKIEILINHLPENLLDKSGGKSRIRPSLVQSFTLLLSQTELASLSNLEIRCFNCGRILSYPAWHFVRRLRRKHFHYFLCFGGSSKARLGCV